MATDAADPWAAARAARRGYAVMRVIDLAACTDSFHTVRGRRDDSAAQYAAGECADQLLDGVTVILPEGDRSAAEVAAIIEQYDDVWRSTRAA